MSESPRYQLVSNYKFPKYFIRSNIEFGLKYEPKNSDKFIVTYPKSGTTWTQHIAQLITNHGHHGQTNPTFSMSSYLEMSGEKFINEPAIKTHLPYEMLPFNGCAKYLLVFRNPKDCCVSFYCFLKKIEPCFNYDFHEFFQHWINGEIQYGDYFEHTLQYWNHRSDDNFQYLVYEQMKDNPRDGVLKIAQFLGQEFVEELENNESLIQEIIEKSSIDSMKRDLKVNEFLMRKGMVGDWKSYFTKEESDLVDHKVKTVFSGTELEIMWERVMKWNKN